MAGINMNRTTEGVVLPPEVSSEIWAKTLHESAVMTAGRQITLPGRGETIPIVLGDPEAAWINETDASPVSESKLSSKNITGYRLSVTELFSNQFMRDLPGLYAELVRRLPYALGKKFDATVLGEVTAPGTDFDKLNTAPSLVVDATDTYKDLTAVFSAVAAAEGALSHWIASPSLQALLLAATDGIGRPLFVPEATTSNTVGQMLARPIIETRGLPTDVIGVAGDFAASAVWGAVNDISVDIYDGAVETNDGKTIALRQRKMVAITAEVEIGFRVRDVNHFVQIKASAAE